MVWYDQRVIQANKFRDAARATRLHPVLFWALALGIWFATQIPIIGTPFVLLSTWVHEFGHGMGAIISGGRFDNMVIKPELSGLAHTYTGSDFARVIVLLGGLLGPACAGAVMLILSRRFGFSKLALLLLTAALLATALFWAGDMFTRVTVFGFGVVVGFIALRTNPLIRTLCAHIIAIAFCLNAVTGFRYFFMSQANVGGYSVQSDTGALATIIGGPHLFWAIVPSLLSVIILLATFHFSGGLGNSQKPDNRKDDL